MQFPPLEQGLGLQSSVLIRQLRPSYPMLQLHVYLSPPSETQEPLSEQI